METKALIDAVTRLITVVSNVPQQTLLLFAVMLLAVFMGLALLKVLNILANHR